MTKARGRHEKTDRTQGELKILSRSSIPKISLFLPRPFPSYFQNTLDTKTYSSQNLMEKTCNSILVVSPELRIYKTPENLATLWVNFVGPFVLLTYLTQIPVTEIFFNNQIWHLKKQHNLSFTRCPSQNQVSMDSQVSMDWPGITVHTHSSQKKARRQLISSSSLQAKLHGVALCPHELKAGTTLQPRLCRPVRTCRVTNTQRSTWSTTGFSHSGSKFLRLFKWERPNPAGISVPSLVSVVLWGVQRCSGLAWTFTGKCSHLVVRC